VYLNTLRLAATVFLVQEIDRILGTQFKSFASSKIELGAGKGERTWVRSKAQTCGNTKGYTKKASPVEKIEIRGLEPTLQEPFRLDFLELAHVFKSKFFGG
jgi:hypothetical protein